MKKPRGREKMKFALDIKSRHIMTSILHTPAILVNMFKTRIERDKLWLERNCIADMPRPLWNIVIDYHTEDPTTVDLIYRICNHVGEYKINGILFWTYISSLGEIALSVPGSFGGQDRYYVSGVKLFTTILILPTIQRDGSEIEHSDMSQYTHTFRRFLHCDLHPSEM